MAEIVSDQKELCFEYFLYKLVEWYRECVPADVNCISLTRIKILKLLFFTSAIKSEDQGDLLDIFDNFHAMQHGPVESDVYNSIASNNFKHYSFTGISLNLPNNNNIDNDSFDDIDENIRERINTSLSLLKNKNENILKYDPFRLVDLSHQWNSWKRTFEIAELMGKGSEKMNTELIRSDKQFFI